ncbi:MAG: hypothetical protein ACF788_06225, partial [Novipirellula sp. JB048]
MNENRTMNFSANYEPGWYVLYVTPFLALLAVFVWGGRIERDAAAELEASLSRLRHEGQPVDNHTLTRWFDDHTSAETTWPWHDILLANEGLRIRFGDLLPDHEEPSPESSSPASSSPTLAAENLQRYTAEADPILAAIEA